MSKNPTNKKQQVFDYLTSIPRGKVSTYGDIAKALGIKSARAVGQILHNNPDPKQYPCHRVVFADGSLSKNFGIKGKDVQAGKLKKEGVSFVQNKVDLKKHLWRQR